MSELMYDNLPVGLRLAGSGDAYELGVTVDGSFQVFGRFVKGGFDEDLAEARAAQQQQASQTSATNSGQTSSPTGLTQPPSPQPPPA